MMDDGGQAFPTCGDEETLRVDGIDLRDWFAGQAIKALVTSTIINGPGLHTEAAACMAYLYADAMLASRKKTPVLRERNAIDNGERNG